ncbi:MAG: hypothetical protein WD036_04525 [Bauldia sp.]
MVEPTDAVMPILKRIQSDVADVKRSQGEHGEKLDAIEGYLTYSLGITQRHVADIESLKEQIAEVRRRIAALEKRK